MPFPLTNFIPRFSDRVKLKSALHFPYILNSFRDKLCETHGIDIIEREVVIKSFFEIHFEITGYPCNLIGFRGSIYSRISYFFTLNRIFFSANENGAVK